MSSRKLPFPVFDADNHFYETEEALTKFLPANRKNAIEYVLVGGEAKIAVRGHIVSNYVPDHTFELVPPPGAQEEWVRHGSGGNSFHGVMGESIKAIPAFREPAPRLEVMDELGIDYALMFPTLASLVEERMKDDPELIHDVIHAFNRWMYENVVVRLQGPYLCHTGDRAADSGAGAGGVGAAPCSVAPARFWCARARPRLPRHPLVWAGRVRPVLAGMRQGRHPGVDARLGEGWVRRVRQRLGAR